MNRHITVEGVQACYGSVVALDDVSLSIERGRPLALLGRNGAGKTTLLSTLAGLVTPTRGHLHVPRGVSVSYLPEERGVYPSMTVTEHLRYFSQISGAGEAAARRWCETFDLVRYSDFRVRELSKGNQQRVQLACALIDDPDCVLLDEPFSGLDPIGETLVSEILADYARDHWVVLSAQDVHAIARMVTDIAFVRDGRIICTGPVEDLCSSYGGHRLTVERPEAVEDAVAGAPGLSCSRTEQGWLQVHGLKNYTSAIALLAQGSDPGNFTWAALNLSELYVLVLGHQKDQS
ncbi:ABC transporter ATP-binding protein [Actinomyces marmotae]|uniref:ABC transporter ATP-binding protein n=1 Tax=Actinomyces marmotae TaxID=2737173 RepID=UPI00135B526E|nr:ABC transporter ATP-binding protein [Actinomyces marmotae]